jgi:hypothetical protein
MNITCRGQGDDAEEVRASRASISSALRHAGALFLGAGFAAVLEVLREHTGWSAEESLSIHLLETKQDRTVICRL